VPGIGAKPWEEYATTVNAIEALSGYDLLALLGDEIEIAAESGLQQGILQVRQLVASAAINAGVGNSLESKLDAAAKQLDRGNVIAAVNQLEALLRELNAMVRSERVTTPEIAALRELVVDLIGSVSS
jgi:hypothetical protein